MNKKSPQENMGAFPLTATAAKRLESHSSSIAAGFVSDLSELGTTTLTWEWIGVLQTSSIRSPSGSALCL
jgi:hypothetical protein